MLIRFLFFFHLLVANARALRGPQAFAYVPASSGRHRHPYIAPRAGRPRPYGRLRP